MTPRFTLTSIAGWHSILSVNMAAAGSTSSSSRASKSESQSNALNAASPCITLSERKGFKATASVSDYFPIKFWKLTGREKTPSRFQRGFPCTKDVYMESSSYICYMARLILHFTIASSGPPTGLLFLRCASSLSGAQQRRAIPVGVEEVGQTDSDYNRDEEPESLERSDSDKTDQNSKRRAIPT